jgi:hypothetical protein
MSDGFSAKLAILVADMFEDKNGLQIRMLDDNSAGGVIVLIRNAVLVEVEFAQEDTILDDCQDIRIAEIVDIVVCKMQVKT